MPKIAIIYTGETRTCETTLPFFKKNVLLDENYDVFSLVQTDNHNHYEKLLRENIGGNLKSLEFFDKNNSIWTEIRENLLGNMNISNEWKHYLRTSGSMVEYYQMYLAYKNLEIYEKEHNFSYDFILRFRTDTVLKDIIDFDYKKYNENSIKSLFYKIKEEMNYHSIISLETISHFMNIFYSKNRTNYEKISFDNRPISDRVQQLLNITNEEEFFTECKKYLLTGNYLIALRKNVIYFSNRESMNHIHTLGITYGNYVLQHHSHWFDAESQLTQICIQNNIDFYSSVFPLEGKSLYSYNHTDYFDENNELIDKEYSFFIKRH